LHDHYVRFLQYKYITVPTSLPISDGDYLLRDSTRNKCNVPV